MYITNRDTQHLHTINCFLFGLTVTNLKTVLTALKHQLAEYDYTLIDTQLRGYRMIITVIDQQSGRAEPIVEVSNCPEQPTELIMLFKQCQFAA